MPASVSESPSLEIRLLGPFEVAVGSVPVDDRRWPRRKPKSLVKLLALQPHLRLHREEVMDLLWPELDARSAANNLHKAIHGARRALEPDLRAGAESRFVATSGALVALRAPGGVTVDAARFEEAALEAIRAGDAEACERAVGLYGGDLMPEDPYDDWASAPRERLRALYRDLLVEAARAHEARGRLDRAVVATRLLLARDAADEEAHRRLMRLYALAGNRHQAAQQFKVCRDALRDELGVEPERETVALHEQIVAGAIEPAARPEAAVEAARSSGNLPHPMTSFVGREGEIAEVGRLLASARALVMTGVGGIGKTRLAIEVATRASADYAEGAWLVELASVSDPSLVPMAVASALGAREEPGRPLVDTIVASLRTRRLLLVLDNCEHLVPACAALTEALLRACPGLRVLATSREALGVTGEVVWQVSSLSLPESGPIEESEAVRLFVDRVRLSNPRFALAEANAEAVRDLCRRLDGIPLAIELAAARARVLSVEQIAERLSDRFRLLAGGRPASPRHQQTLRSTIDWSYDLLSEDERRLFRQLSVFSGGFTLAAAEEVVGGGAGIAARPPTTDEVLDVLSRLIDKSLVISGEGRFSMLETIRQYAEERLDETGESPRLVALHRDWYVALAEREGAELQGPREAAALATLDLEHDNLRAALRRSTSDGDAARSLRLCCALWRYWHVRAHHGEGRMWLDRALALAGDAPEEARAQALYGAGNLAIDRGDYERAGELLEACLELRRRAGDRRGTAHTLTRLGYVARCLGDTDRAAALQEESLALCRELGDLHGVAHAVTSLGVMAADGGGYERAAGYFEEALAIYRRLGFKRGTLVMLHNLGELAQLHGDLERAERLVDESLAVARELSDTLMTAYSTFVLGKVANDRGEHARAVELFDRALAMHRGLGDMTGAVYVIEGFACAAAALGDAARALRLAGAAAVQREAMRLNLSATEQAVLDRYLEPARRSLGAAASALELEAGRRMGFEAAVGYATLAGSRSIG